MTICKARALPERRQGLLDFCERVPHNHHGLVVEIGSWLGESALIFADYFQQVVCIDPWRDDYAADATCVPWQAGHSMDEVYAAFLDTVKGAPNIAHIRATWEQAIDYFPLQSVDVIYLDANHGLDETANAIARCRLRVKSGGFLAGHDYGHELFPGVAYAVDVFGRYTGIDMRKDSDTTWSFQL